jgi:hypothetical protein
MLQFPGRLSLYPTAGLLYSTMEGGGEFIIPGVDVRAASFPTGEADSPEMGVDVAGGIAVGIRVSDINVAACWGNSVPGASVISGGRVYCVPDAQAVRKDNKANNRSFDLLFMKPPK